MTGIHSTVESGDLYGLVDLIELGHDVNAKDEAGKSPLHWAAQKERMNIVFSAFEAEIISLLIAEGAEVDMKDETGSTPLHLAALSGNLAAAVILIQSGANVKSQDNLGFTPLHHSKSRGHMEIVALLGKAGAVL